MLFPKLRNSDPVLGWIDSEEQWDTYLNLAPPPTEPMRCPICGNVYKNKEWYQPGLLDLDVSELPQHICPACKEKMDQYYRGVLTIHGSFLREHREEISNLVVNEIRRRQVKNPLHRVVKVEVEEGCAVLKVTRGKLAERIGRKLKKAYDGELDVQWTEEITRVDWGRELAAESSD